MTQRKIPVRLDVLLAPKARKSVTPECFYRGSTVLTIVRPRGSRRATLSHVEWVGGPVPLSLDSRLKHAGMTDFGKTKHAKFGRERLIILQTIFTIFVQPLRPWRPFDFSGHALREIFRVLFFAFFAVKFPIPNPFRLRLRHAVSLWLILLHRKPGITETLDELKRHHTSGGLRKV